jgi:uncharacterized protein YjbI with pentapeptide repeats
VRGRYTLHPRERRFIPNNPMFNVEHYDRLIACAERHRGSEWNTWRRAHPDEQILLEEAQFEHVNLERFDLSKAHLRKAMFTHLNLSAANLSRADLEEAVFECATLKSSLLIQANLVRAKFGQVDMSEAKLDMANLSSADLSEAILSKARLIQADLRSSYLTRADLNGACLRRAVLKKTAAHDASFAGAELERANLEYASLHHSDLNSANLKFTSLIRATLHDADLRRATLDNADLRSANLTHARVDEGTSLWVCPVDRKTDFFAVPLGNVRIDTGTRQLLEYNLRRKAWNRWCKQHWFTGKLTRLFWIMSDYGLSTTRILQSFLIAAVSLALVYWALALVFPPGVIGNLTVGTGGEPVASDMLFVRSLYFSVVTMTTLGLGDMYAKSTSLIGHVLLMLQVLLGYVMLGAIVTRFSILFTGGGPAGRHFGDFEEGKCKSLYWSDKEMDEFVRERDQWRSDRRRKSST